MLWERKVDNLFYFAWFVQDIVVELGLVIAGVLTIYQIADGFQKVGSFAFLMYVASLVSLQARTPIC